MAKKTNKTSHVMDLLTNGVTQDTGAPASESAPEAVSGQDMSSVRSHTVTPKKVTVVDKGSRDDRVSQEILSNLTQELEKETRESAPQVQAAEPSGESSPAPAPSEAVSPSPALSAANTEEPLLEAAGLGEVSTANLGPTAKEELKMEQQVSNGAAMKVSAQNIIPESLINSNLQDGEYRFINVMELLLLRQDVHQLMEEHNVCTCERCMADVCALTLTGLPSKYVVTSKDSISPILSYYENRYKIPMLTEFMKACSKVRERPRHKK